VTDRQTGGRTDRMAVAHTSLASTAVTHVEHMTHI